MKSAVIVFPGSNCDRDMAEALRLVTGRAPAMVWHRETELPDGLDLIAVPGGFSYGDYLRSGAMAARSPVMRAVIEAAARGVPVLGVCNGFQVLTEARLLPGALMRNAGHQLRLPRRRADGREQPVGLHRALRGGRGDRHSRSPIMTAISRPTRRRSTGSKAKAASPSAMPATVNGSARGIAGILNEAGNVLGMMPHPERAVEAAHGRATATAAGLFEGGLPGKSGRDQPRSDLAWPPAAWYASARENSE